MRKIAFLLGLVVMTTSLAFAQSNYTAESDGTYTYTGSPVDELSIDFTTWAIADLPSALTDDMAAAESHNMAFVKWKIQTRSCGDKGSVHALFNNNTGDAGVTIPNASSTNPPRVYLPTTSGSVGNITVYAGSANAWLKVFYKDDEHTSWTQASSIPTVSDFGERSVALNSKGQTSIYLEYAGSQYICITNLDMEIDAPEPSIYQKESDGTYTYTGEPVDALSVDFTAWELADLPSALTDDMDAAESHNMAFVKWKIATRSCGSKGNVHALFNNNTGDAGVTIPNNTTTNPPRIYLPTTSYGVKKLIIFGGNGNNLAIKYKDADHASWTDAGTISLNGNSNFAEQEKVLNTNGQTSIYLEFTGTTYPAITNIDLEIEQPEESVYALDPQSGLYVYTGEPVDAINVDFTTWTTSDLPSPLTDDMPLAQKHGLGFVKWKIDYSSSTYTLFNNNAADFGGSPTNNATTNPPTIYFPTTVRGVVSVAITYTGGNNFVMKGTYTDAIQTHSENIEFPAASTPNTVVWNLSSAGQTKVYLQYFGAVWPRIRSIVFTIKDTEAEPLVLWAKADSHGNTNRIVAANGEERDVYLKRAFTADGNYYTLCLPFDLTAEQVTAAFGSCTLAKLTSSEMNGDEINLNFADDITSIEAGVPYLFLPTADIESCYFPAVTINADASRVINTTYFKMTGIYNPTVLTGEDYFMGTDNYLVQVTDENPLLPFRAYFSLANGGSLSAPARVVFHHSGATGLENTQKATVGIQKLFRDGHMFIQRGETVYTINGQMVK